MAFHPSSLPASARAVFEKSKHAGGFLWPNVVEAAVKSGVTDADKLADIVFYLFHPDLIGTSLAPGTPNYQQLSREWIGIRAMVEPATRAKPRDRTSPKLTQPSASGTPLHASVGDLNKQSGLTTEQINYLLSKRR